MEVADLQDFILFCCEIRSYNFCCFFGGVAKLSDGTEFLLQNGFGLHLLLVVVILVVCCIVFFIWFWFLLLLLSLSSPSLLLLLLFLVLVRFLFFFLLVIAVVGAATVLPTRSSANKNPIYHKRRISCHQRRLHVSIGHSFTQRNLRSIAWKTFHQRMPS